MYATVATVILPDTPRWQTAAWLWLNAHGTGIDPVQLGGTIFSGGYINLVDETELLLYLRGAPLILSAFGGVLVCIHIGYTTRALYLIQNASAVVIGYSLTGVVFVYLSDAQPTFEAVFLILSGVTLTLFVGGFVLSRVSGGLVIIGIASVWAIIGVGVVFLLGGLILLNTIIPLVLYPLGGSLLAALLVYVSRTINL